jgi:hypothetical protein
METNKSTSARAEKSVSAEIPHTSNGNLQIINNPEVMQSLANNLITGETPDF